ncbi:MAG: complex I NDUFA9 subunit family protein, partial [Alphaproteobacteria bacterium]
AGYNLCTFFKELWHMSIKGKLVTIFGGSGFVGRYVVQKLAKEGAIIRIAGRYAKSALFLKTMGDVGQITPVEVNIRDKESIAQAIDGSYAVVNLIGVLQEKSKNTFEDLHVIGPNLISQVASESGVKKFVQMSAINADPNSPSKYASTKGQGEARVWKNFPNATIVRPSVIFGAEDRFMNMFASMARISPALPLVGGGETKFQPVYVCDVAEAIMRVVCDRRTTSCPYNGKVYELGGPQVYSFKEILEYVGEITGRNSMFVPIPYPAADILGRLMQWIPDAPLTADQVKLLQKDSVVHSGALSFKELDIKPAAMESIVPEYLGRYKRHA